jgi:hypothetical protein
VFHSFGRAFAAPPKHVDSNCDPKVPATMTTRISESHEVSLFEVSLEFKEDDGKVRSISKETASEILHMLI